MTGFAPLGSRPLATVAYNYSLSATQGSYSLTGFAAVPAGGVPATSGTYSVTGYAASSTAALHLAAGQGTYSLTGNSALPGLSTPATAGAYSLSGNAVTFTATWNISADQGSYTLSGFDALPGKAAEALGGTYALTGYAASANAAWALLVEAGSYALSGQDADFSHANFLSLAAETGAYGLTGSDATASITSPSSQHLGPLSFGEYSQIVVPKEQSTVRRDIERAIRKLNGLPEDEDEAREAIAEVRQIIEGRLPEITTFPAEVIIILNNALAQLAALEQAMMLRAQQMVENLARQRAYQALVTQLAALQAAMEMDEDEAIVALLAA